MPVGVVFGNNQIWKGTKYKYIFIDNKLGSFKSVPESLMSTSWKKGYSGHPSNKSLAGKKKAKKVINLDLNKIFISAREGSKEMGLALGAVSEAILSKGKAGGYNWAYCDDEGNVIETKKTKPVTPA